MQGINLKRFVNLKSLLYLFLLALAYYLGDMDLEKFATKRLNLVEATSERNITRVGEYLVTKVVDGDTVHVLDDSGQEEVVRFLAVDTLEKDSTDSRERCLAKLQTKFTEENLLNKKVYLENDPTQPKKDKYGRTLAYLSLVQTDSGSPTTTTFNQVLIQTGNAKVYRADPPAKLLPLFVTLQTEAQNNHLGMWNPELCK